MFQQQARTERYKTVHALQGLKMEEGANVSNHVLKMKSHLDHLERLEHPYPLALATDLILNSLSKFYDTFILNYNMNGSEKTILELHLMLRTAENNIPKKPNQVLMIWEGRVKKPKHNNSKSKGKFVKVKGKQVAQAPPAKKDKVAKNDPCFECGLVGYWKRNCPTYLAELMKNKLALEGNSGIYVISIDLFSFSPNTWVLLDVELIFVIFYRGS